MLRQPRRQPRRAGSGGARSLPAVTDPLPGTSRSRGGAVGPPALVAENRPPARAPGGLGGAAGRHPARDNDHHQEISEDHETVADQPRAVDPGRPSGR